MTMGMEPVLRKPWARTLVSGKRLLRPFQRRNCWIWIRHITLHIHAYGLSARTSNSHTPSPPFRFVWSGRLLMQHISCDVTSPPHRSAHGCLSCQPPLRRQPASARGPPRQFHSVPRSAEVSSHRGLGRRPRPPRIGGEGQCQRSPRRRPDAANACACGVGGGVGGRVGNGG